MIFSSKIEMKLRVLMKSCFMEISSGKKTVLCRRLGVWEGRFWNFVVTGAKGSL